MPTDDVVVAQDVPEGAPADDEEGRGGPPSGPAQPGHSSVVVQRAAV